MFRRFVFPAMAGLVLGVPFSGAASSQEIGAAALIPEDSVQLVLSRFETLEQMVGSLQQEVMEASAELQAEQAEVSALVEAAVYELDPELRADMEARIQQEAQEAQAAANTARLQQLEQEFVALRTRAAEAEQAALEQPEIKSRVETFQDALLAEMARVNPEIDVTMSELETLAERLNLTLNGG